MATTSGAATAAASDDDDDDAQRVIPSISFQFIQNFVLCPISFNSS